MKIAHIFKGVHAHNLIQHFLIFTIYNGGYGNTTNIKLLVSRIATTYIAVYYYYVRVQNIIVKLCKFGTSIILRSTQKLLVWPYIKGVNIVHWNCGWWFTESDREM